MPNQLENRLRELLEEILGETDSYLVELKMKPNKVEVYADRDPHITIDDCARINRLLAKKLDAEFPFSSRYALEVSSPGMDQPLKVQRQFKKNLGRTVDVMLHSGAKKSGVLLYADEEKILIEEQQRGEGKETKTIQSEIPFVQIKSTLLVFNFKF
jgi:ribosome maturation factor RimP